MAESSPSGDAPPAVVESAPVPVKKAPKPIDVPKEQPAKTLIIGEGVFFEGMTEGCVLAVVGGKFRGTVNSQRVEVTKTGKAEGAAITETAEIAGVFEGNLAVRKSLKVSASSYTKVEHDFVQYRTLQSVPHKRYEKKFDGSFAVKLSSTHSTFDMDGIRTVHRVLVESIMTGKFV